MPSLFWLLLAAARGGYKYLRSILRVCVGLRAGAEMAPGTDAAAELGAAAALRAVAELRTAHDLHLMGRAGELGLSAVMAFWIVNDVVFRWTAELGLEAVPGMAPGVSGAAVLPGQIPLDAAVQTAPPVPAVFRRTVLLELGAAAETAPSIPMAAERWIRIGLMAGADTAPAISGAAALTAALPGLSAQTDPGAPDAAAVRLGPVMVLTAKMMCWAAPEWVDSNTLYIRQVYSATQDGDVLILY